MTDIAIRPLQRTELPPSTVGAGKPPLSLADRSGEIGLALATAQFAGDRFNDVVAAKAANEHAEFQGIAAAEMEAFDTFVVSKPGASFEELEAERNTMVARIEAAGKKATTRSAQQSNKNWMLRNKGNIYNQTQTSMEAIRTQQALATFNVQRKSLITNFKENELTDLYAGQVESRLMTKEFAAAQLAADLSVIDVAEKKVQLEQAKVGLETRMFQMAAEHGYEAAETRLRDPQTTARLLEAGVKREDIKSLLTDVSERMKHVKVVADEKLETQREVDRGDIYEAINVGEVKLPDGSTSTDIRKFIEQSSLDADERESMWQKSIKETERKLKGEAIITNPRLRSQFYREIPLMLSGAVSRDDILNRANNARFGHYKLKDTGQKLTPLTATKEAEFQRQYAQVSMINNLDPDPDDPMHFYDYRGLFKETGSLAVGTERHFPSKFKLLGHPNLIVDGKDTRTGKAATAGLITKNQEAHDAVPRGARGEYIEPSMSDPDYKALVGATNAQYEQGYGQMMAKVNDYAEGILLKTDSLGFVENAPVRHKQMGDFQEAWFNFVASKGDKLKISDIYPEGRRLAATFQITDEEAQSREEIFNTSMKAKEAAVTEIEKALREDKQGPIDKDLAAGRKLRKKLTPQIARRYLDLANNNVEEAKRLAAEDGYRE